MTELQTNLQNEFQKKLFPILEAIRKEKDLQILLSAQESGAIVIEPGIDLTNEAVKRLDAQSIAPAFNMANIAQPSESRISSLMRSRTSAGIRS